MSIIERIRRIAKANLNEILDHAESPERMVRQRIRELDQVIGGAKESLATFGVSLKKLEKEAEQLKRVRDEWLLRAEKSVQLGDEPAARNALAEKAKVEDRIRDVMPSLESSRATYQELRDNVGVLGNQLQAAKMRLAELESRRSAASAQKAIGSSLDQSASKGVDGGEFSRLEGKVLQEEAEAEVERDLRHDSPDQVERTAQALEVDAELEALKKRMKKQK